MRHLIFALLVGVYILQFGQAWTWYAATLLIAAYARHGGKLLAPLK